METTHKRTNSNTQIPSRPTTPLRPSSRTSLRSSTAFPHQHHDGGGGEYTSGPSSSTTTPLVGLEGAFAELADGMADLEANMMHVQLLHESLARFGENFAAFLYGLNVNAFCVDFPEAPLVPDSFRRARMREEEEQEDAAANKEDGGADPDVTIVSTATSFVDHPSTAGSRSRFATPAAAGRRTTAATAGRGAGTAGGGASRAGSAAAGGRGVGRTRASGIARGASARGRPGVR